LWREERDSLAWRDVPPRERTRLGALFLRACVRARSSRRKEDLKKIKIKSRLRKAREGGFRGQRTDCIVQVPVPQIVDCASRPAHYQRAGAKEKDVL
jgi:hypothetical protein